MLRYYLSGFLSRSLVTSHDDSRRESIIIKRSGGWRTEKERERERALRGRQCAVGLCGRGRVEGGGAKAKAGLGLLLFWRAACKANRPCHSKGVEPSFTTRSF